jgi:hypothetical protein
MHWNAAVMFVVTGVLLFFGLGLPISYLLPRDIPDPLAAAPIFGLALYGVTTTVLYRYGVNLHFALAVQCFAAMEFIVVSAFRWPFSLVWTATLVVCSFATAILAILPMSIGGYQFAIFQANFWDQFNYISGASAYARYGYVDFADIGKEGQTYTLAAAYGLTARPTVEIVLASLWPHFFSTAALAAYPYQVLLQILAGFGILFVARSVFLAGAMESLCLFLAFALGFFVQYIADISAWSSLAAISFWPVLVGLLCIALSRPLEVKLIIAFAVTASGILYFYPESVAVGLPACMGVFASYLLIMRPKLPNLASLTLPLSACVVIPLLMCIPMWSATVGFLVDQMIVAKDVPVEWYRAYGAFYSGDGEVLGPITTAYQFVSHPIDLFMGAAGIYFLHPPSILGSGARVIWKMLEGLFALALLVAGILSFIDLKRKQGTATIFLIACLASLIVPVLLAMSGQYWSAGKVVSMSSPFIFFLCASSLFSGNKVIALPAIIFLMLQLGFGLERIYAASRHRDRATAPYPGLPEQKRDYNWDVAKWQDNLKGCQKVAFNIENPHLERLAETVVSDLRIPWASRLDRFGNYSDGDRVPANARTEDHFDCDLTDNLRHPVDGKLIYLKSGRAVHQGR